MRSFINKDQATAFAQFKSRLTGSDYRVIENGERFLVGTEGKIMRHFPDSIGWNFRFHL